MTEVIGLVGELGTAGGIATVAWLFRDDFPRTSRVCLIAAIVLMGVVAVSEAVRTVVASEFELVVEPPPDRPGSEWGGVYQSGASAGEISATLVKNEDEVVNTIRIPPVEISNRDLDVALDPARSDRRIA